MGRLLGSLKDLSGSKLGAIAIRGALAKAGVAEAGICRTPSRIRAEAQIIRRIRCWLITTVIAWGSSGLPAAREADRDLLACAPTGQSNFPLRSRGP
jgi:hypothetical protein